MEVAYQTSWYDIEVCRLRLTTGILLFPVLSAQSKAAIAKTGIIISAFTYLPSAEKESGFRIAVTGFADSKSMDKSCQVYGNFHAGNPVMIAGRRTYIAVQCYQL